MRKTTAIITCIILISIGLEGQKIDNMAIHRNMGSENYFRFSYDNDYFAARDHDYTQGYSFEIAHPRLAKNPLNNLLIKPKGTTLTHGLALEHIGYTPYRYTVEEIQYGDRPFASAIMLKSFISARNNVKRSTLTSTLSLGMMGPIAFGEAMQVSIHEATGNKIPLGWDNQIRNDVIVNYRLAYSKEMLRLRDAISVHGVGTVQLGTLFTNVSLGTSLMLGLNTPSYSSSENKSNFRLYLFADPRATLIEYDATLQGGKIKQNSPYTIGSRDIERLTTTLEFGLILQSQKLFLEYTRSFISKEFKSGDAARWGGIKLGLKF